MNNVKPPKLTVNQRASASRRVRRRRIIPGIEGLETKLLLATTIEIETGGAYTTIPVGINTTPGDYTLTPGGGRG